jgi:hypothetical protein
MEKIFTVSGNHFDCIPGTCLKKIYMLYKNQFKQYDRIEKQAQPNSRDRKKLVMQG